MNPLWLAVIVFAVLLFLIMMGMHVAFAMGITGFVGLIFVIGWIPALNMMGVLPWAEVSSWSLAVIPLFILMGYFAYHAKIATESFWAARQWMGGIPGGLAIATIGGCAALATCTGASSAACAIMAKIAYPEMQKYGYNAKLITGTIASGATLAILIPPSVMLVVYGILTETSITALLLGGFIPGIILATMYALVIAVTVKLKPGWGPRVTGITWKARFVSLKGVWGFLLIMLIIIGGLYTGVFTATEAGGIGAAATFVLALSRRGITRDNMRETLRDTVETTVMVFTLILGVFIFGRYLSYAGITPALSRWVVDLQVSPYWIFFAVVVLYSILGCFMLGLAMVTFTIPIIFPPMTALGFDPVWLGIIVVILVELSEITPPVGLTLFVIKGVAKDVPLGDIMIGAIPFVIADLLTIVLLTIWPDIVLFLPRIAGMR